MPDRRQNDRRESSGLQSKRVTISLTTFISTVAIVATILIAIVACFIVDKLAYNRGYEQGIIESFDLSTSNKDYSDFLPVLDDDELLEDLEDEEE